MSTNADAASINAMLTAHVNAIGPSPKLKLFVESKPAHCATADPATLLATITLPASPLSVANQVISMANGPWTGTGSAAGTATSWRIYDSSTNTCRLQGTLTPNGGGGDATMDNNVIANGQALSVNSLAVSLAAWL